MSLVLSRNRIGKGWLQIPLGAPVGTLDQYYRIDPDGGPSSWQTVPFFADDRYLCRMGNNYRTPVSTQAKVSALWAAKSKLFRRYVLRRAL